jgi:hypothetical protein
MKLKIMSQKKQESINYFKTVSANYLIAISLALHKVLLSQLKIEESSKSLCLRYQMKISRKK